jgi:DNA mismatch repair protein MutS
LDEIGRFHPAEIIVNEAYEGARQVEAAFSVRPAVYSAGAFNTDNSFQSLTEHFHTITLEGYGLERQDLEVNAAGALITYLVDTQKNDLAHISSLRKYSDSKYMVLDLSSRRNLELTETIRGKRKSDTLLEVLDQTKTAMGARTLRKWIEQPLLDLTDINRRLDSVEAFKDNVIPRAELRELLESVQDIERIMTRVVYQTANSRDLIALRNSLRNLPNIRDLLNSFPAAALNDIQTHFDTLTDIFEAIEHTLVDDPPISLREGGFIKTGHSSELDKLREAKQNGSAWLSDLEQKEREQTGIRKLRICFNRVFGYAIEVPNSNKLPVPERYIRRQTLVNCERYVTPELKHIEDEILGADEKATILEYNLFCALRSQIAAEVTRIQLTAAMIASVDALQSLGEAADRNHYVKPTMDDGGTIDIINGRHPVVEHLTNMFVANDTYLDCGDDRMAIITGPNMGGKSTYMRQTALIVLMAQAGSFVPADSAHIGVVDRIFTRVGASDDLATGQSTFMIEMAEVANILNNASGHSLLILDEIGRGTSTFDGLSIAWAVLEHICQDIGAKTLFATHYHELTELEGHLPGVKNYCVTISEDGDEIIFLHKIARGGADHSYGIQVARLAGLPAPVLDRSQQILDELVTADIARKQKPQPSTRSVHKRRRSAQLEEDQIMIQEMLDL